MTRNLKTVDFKKNLDDKLRLFKTTYKKRFGSDLVIRKGADKKVEFNAQAIFVSLNSYDKSLFAYVFFESHSIRAKFVKDGEVNG